MSSALTPSEIGELERLEAIMQRGQQTFLEVAGAALQIRERRLYRRDYDSFEAYCQNRWKWSRKRLDQIINSALAVQGLPTKVATIVANEGQARALAKVEPEKRLEVLAAASEKGPITAQSIAEAAKPGEPQPTTEPTPELDKTGWPIPPDLLPLWSRAGEVVKLMSVVSTLKGALEKAQADEDPLFRPLTAVNSEGNSQSWSGMIADFTNVRRGLKLCIPYAVCLACQGKLCKKCTTCLGRGFVSEHFWERSVAKEDKAMRAKILEANDKIEGGDRGRH